MQGSSTAAIIWSTGILSLKQLLPMMKWSMKKGNAFFGILNILLKMDQALSQLPRHVLKPCLEILLLLFLQEIRAMQI